MTTSHPSRPTADFTNSFMAGQKLLNRYTLGRILGQGGMGVVWLARDEELEREIALKFLPSVVVNDRASLLDLKRETKRTLELTHPNIVRTYDFVQDSTIAGISMEYVECDTLRNRKIDQPDEVFQPADLGEWVLQLCEALDYAHHHAAIVHRDLKPANLLINGRNQVKVADFGISRSLSESVTQVTGRQGASGTLVYMSPQQLAGDQGHPLDDIYAVGSTLYELCTKRPPFFTGDIAGQVYGKVPPPMAQRRAELEVPVGEIPENWEKTVAACLSKNPLERPQSAGEIAVRLGLKEAATLSTPSAAFPAPSAATHEASSFTEMVRIAKPPANRPADSSPFTSTPTVVRKPKNALPMVAGIAAAVVVAGVAGWLIFGRPSGEPGKRVAPAVNNATVAEPAQSNEVPVVARSGSGTLFVETTPKDAMVSVDGQAVGRTPLSKEKLAVGRHTLAVVLEGYDVVAQQVDVVDGNLTRLPKIVLQRSKGEIEIATSVPAELTVAGPDNPLSPQRVANPWKAMDMPIGDYQISVKREGWKPIVRTEKLTAGTPLRVNIDLTPGSLEIINALPKTVVTVNGKLAGQVPVGATTLKVAEVEPGEADYSLELAGYQTKADKIAVKAGAPAMLDGKMAKTASTAAAKTTHTGSSSSSGNSNSSGHSNEGSSGSNWQRWIPRGGFGRPF